MTVLASGILLYRKGPGGPNLLLLRNRGQGHWGFAKGRRDPGDAHEVACALREVEEETGYADLTLHDHFRAEIDYVVRDPDGDYPKRVVYFLAEAPTTEPHLSSEHEEHLWADVDEANERLPFGQMRDLAAMAFATIRAS